MRSLGLTASISLFLALHVLFAGATANFARKRDYNKFNYYVLEHDPAHGHSAHDCAAELGAELVEQAGQLRDHWVIRAAKPELVVAREAGAEDVVLNRLRVIRSVQESSLVKREANMRRAIKGVTLQTLRRRAKRGPVPVRLESRQDGAQSLARSIAQRLGISDPLFPQQWHLINDEYPEHMMNATSVWDMGITGHGVTSAMVDDGLDYASEDIKDNFVSLLL